MWLIIGIIQHGIIIIHGTEQISLLTREDIPGPTASLRQVDSVLCENGRVVPTYRKYAARWKFFQAQSAD